MGRPGCRPQTPDRGSPGVERSPEALRLLAAEIAPAVGSIDLRQSAPARSLRDQPARAQAGPELPAPSHPTKKRPSSCVRKARSFALDANMYKLFEHQGVQYIQVMSLISRQRIIIPLTGHTPITGNLRVVLDFDRQRVEIHYTAELDPSSEADEAAPDEAVCGLDAGLT